MDFKRSVIEVNSETNRWGPYAFDFGLSLPASDPIETAVVSSRPLSDLDLDSNIVEPGSVVVVSPASVRIHVQYPGGEQLGHHVLLFDLTLASGARQRFRFGYVLVR